MVRGALFLTGDFVAARADQVPVAPLINDTVAVDPARLPGVACIVVERSVVVGDLIGLAFDHSDRRRPPSAGGEHSGTHEERWPELGRGTGALAAVVSFSSEYSAMPA